MNAKEEFQEHTEGKAIKCALLHSDEEYDFDIKDYTILNKYILKQDFTGVDFDNFLKAINFNYDDGFGGQELFGTIWYKDGTFSNRGEYDGSEWRQHQEPPEIPKELL